MKIVRIELDESMPTEILAELSIEEAAQIARWSGRLTADRTDETSEIYECLAGELFNRYWDNGVDGYLSGDSE